MSDQMDRFASRAALLATMRGLRADLDRVIAEAGAARIAQPGSFGELSFKDLVAHLTGWRLRTAARLEAGLRHEEPISPWPAQLSEEHDLDAINRWFFEASRDQPVADVLRESHDTFDRVAHAIEALPEADLLQPGRFPWLGEWALGPAVVSGTYSHYHEDHEPEIRAWLAQG